MSRPVPAAVSGLFPGSRRERLLLGLVLATAAGLSAGGVRAEPPVDHGVVATVNGESIRDAELQIMTGMLLSNVRSASRDDINEAEDDARERLIRAHAIAQEAAELGLDQEAAFQGAMAYQRAVLLERAYYKEQLRRNPVAASAVEQEYRALVVDGKIHEYHLRHIMVPRKYRGEQIVDLLKKGESFEQLAKLYSSDMATSAAGGEIGWVNLADMDDHRFVDAVLVLKPDGLTPEPVHGARGWHVIQLLDVPKPLPKLVGYDDLPEATKTKLRLRAQQRYIASLEERVYADAKVKREALMTRESTTGTLGMAE